MFEKFSKWYFGPNMKDKDKRPYLYFILITHVACVLAMFGPVRHLGPNMWASALLLDVFMHARKIDGRYPLSMPGALLVMAIAASLQVLMEILAA